MRPATAILATRALLKKYDVRNYVVEINTRIRRLLGRCWYPGLRGEQGIIELGEGFVFLNEVTKVEQVIKHEIAHALTGVGHPHHGDRWKHNAILVGVPPTACTDDAISPPKNWIAVCSGCQGAWKKYRRPPGQRYCVRCGPVLGELVWKRLVVSVCENE